GTSHFRGGLRYFLINDALNARSFFDPRVSPDKVNAFGGQLGGPLPLPGITKPRVFFFADYEGARTGGGVLQPFIVLTASEGEGNFSGDLSTTKPLDPKTGKRFPNFLIPQSRLDPIAQTYWNRFVPLPEPGGRIAREFLPTQQQNDQLAARLDYEASEVDRLS